MENLIDKVDKIMTENEELKEALRDEVTRSDLRFKRAEEFNAKHEAWLLKELNLKQEEINDLQFELLVLNEKYNRLI